MNGIAVSLNNRLIRSLSFVCFASDTYVGVILLQIIEVCLVSLITSVLSFGLPLLRKCSPCPTSGANSNIECPNAPGIDGNYVDVSSES